MLKTKNCSANAARLSPGVGAAIGPGVGLSAAANANLSQLPRGDSIFSD